MKVTLKNLPLLLSVSATLLCNRATAQEWFPAGATWTYAYQSVSSREFHQARLGVISQLTERGRTISTIDILSDNGAEFAVCQTISLPFFVYVSNDSVYYATRADSTYRLAMLTNARLGDTWHIAGQGIDGPDLNLISVENVDTIPADGTNFRKWTYESTAFGGSDDLAMRTRAEALEYGGSLFSMVFPLGTLSGCDAVTNIELWCYSDGAVNYVSSGAKTCAVDFKPLGAWSPLLIYPNPNQDKVYFKFNGPAARVQVYDEQGWTPVLDRTPDLQKRQMEMAPVSFGVFMTGFQ